MNLGKNIYNLLKRQSAVSVAGLGTFKRNHSPATFDANRNVYLPPITYIDFDKEAENGYDFIQYIQQLDQIDRQEAEHLVAQGVDDLHKRIREDGQAKLDDLGHLVSYGQSFVFKALDLSGFNYEPVEALVKPPLPVAPEEEPAVEAIIEEPVVAPIVDEAIAEDAITALPTEEQPIAAAFLDPELPTEDSYEVPAKGNNTLWYVITAIFALGIIAALYFVNQKSTVLPSAKVAEETLTKPIPAEPKAPVDSLVQKDSLNVLGLDSIPAKRDSLVAVPANHTWQIVIGSHRTLAQAYEQAESYNKAGYASVRVIPSNLAKNRKKVIWDSYSTKEELDSALMYVQKRVIKDAWPDRIK